MLELACGPARGPRAARHAVADGGRRGACEMLRSRPRRSAPAAASSGRTCSAWRPDRRYDVVFFGFWLSHVPLERFDSFWSLVADRLAPGGRVFFADDGYRTPDELVAGESSSTIRRRLNDGSAHRAVKVPYEPGELEAQLARLGWRISVTPTCRSVLLGRGRAERAVSCRAGTRTPTPRSRDWRAANYTTRHGAAASIALEVRDVPGSIVRDSTLHFRPVAVAPRREAGIATRAAPYQADIAPTSTRKESACQRLAADRSNSSTSIPTSRASSIPRRAREAAQRLYARAIDVPRGRWVPERRACCRARARSGCSCSTACWCARRRSPTIPPPSCSARATCCAPGTTTSTRSCCRARSSGPR